MRRALLLSLLITTATAVAVTSDPITIKDAKGDVAKRRFDLRTVTFKRISGQRLRVKLVTDRAWLPKDLAPKSGIPGSMCLRIWLKTRPKGNPPEYLVCATMAAERKTLQASVTKEVDGQSQRIAFADVDRASAYSVTITFTQASIGSPRIVKFAAETTAPGCTALKCSDSAPNAGGRALRIPS